jgi:hypothetical protein
MASIASALRTKLLSVSAISSLIGQRMYTDWMPPKAATPCIVYSRISTLRDHYLADVTRSAHSRFEVVCIADSRAQADQVAEAVRKSGICSYQGTTDGYLFHGTEIDSGDEYGDDPPNDGSQVHRYWVRFDLMVHYSEAS